MSGRLVVALMTKWCTLPAPPAAAPIPLHLPRPALLRPPPLYAPPRATRTIAMNTTNQNQDSLDAFFKQKRILHSNVRKALKSMDPTLRSHEDNAIQNIVLEAPWFKSCQRLCAYISCSALREVETSKLLFEILQSPLIKEGDVQLRKKLYVPRVEDKNSHMRMLNISCIDDLVMNLMNILEPAPVDSGGNEREDATHVSTWKQKIEYNLEEQESHPAFDIHDYGERILGRLSFEPDNENVLSFADVVKGQQKYNVARSFSALLQLVNNGDVELDRSGVAGESVCYTAVNPFRVWLLRHDKRREETGFQLSRKRVKSPLRKASQRVDNGNTEIEKSPLVKSSSKAYKSTWTSPLINRKLPTKVGIVGGKRCTPKAKRKRKSRFVEPVNLHSAG